MAPGAWNAETDRKLLLLIIKDAGVKINNAKIASQMSTTEWTCTAKAVESRVVRLKALAKDLDNAGETNASGNTEAATKPKAVGNRGHKRNAAAMDDELDGRIAPRKRAQRAPKGRKGKETKAASDDGEEDDEDNEEGDTVVKGELSDDEV